MSVGGAAMAGSPGWAWRSALSPVASVGGFAALYLVLSLLGALLVGWLTGRTTLGLWYIAPFTLAFVFAYQRLVYQERLRDLGLDPRAPMLRQVGGGFLVAGLTLTAIQAVQLGAGAMEVRSINVLTLGPEALALGLMVAVALNFGTGLGEELVFRGFILHRLLGGYRGRAPGVVISALVYSGAHAQGTRDGLVLLNLFLLGVVLALAVVLTRSLWASIGGHMGWNFWGRGVDFYAWSESEKTQVVSYAYHLQDWGDLFAFRMVATVALVSVGAWLAVRIRQQAREGLPSAERA